LISYAGADFWGLMNDPYVGQEIAQSLAGTSGLLLTIPLTATFFVLQERVLRKNRRQKAPENAAENVEERFLPSGVESEGGK
jgi:uncharacterized membrane protein